MLIGTLEQLNLAQLLQRLEAYAKTGLLVIKRGGQWVELYFQQGRLTCLGPVEANITMGDRLLRAGVISPQARQDSMFALSALQSNETRVALTLMDMGYVTHEKLRAWATREAGELLRTLLAASTGEVYFEDGLQPSPERLQIALSIGSLLQIAAETSRPQPIRDIPPTSLSREQSGYVSLNSGTSGPSEYLSASQLLSASASIPAISPSFSAPEGSRPTANPVPLSPTTSTLSQPRPIPTPVMPRRIDTSFMKPEMVLVPTDLSTLRERNPQLQLTPEQWRLFTRTDGATSLQMACQVLGFSRDQVCQVAGELIALGLVYPALPTSLSANAVSPSSREPVAAGMSSGYVAPGYAAAPAQPWAAMLPTTDRLPPFAQPSFGKPQAQGNSGRYAISSTSGRIGGRR